MLVSFSARNFLAFRERVEWSLVASADKTRNSDNVVELPAFGLRLLKSAVVYGANASGKSKLVDVLEYMRWFVRGSSSSGQVGTPTQVEPFKLNSASTQAPSEFEIQFIYQGELYRYGFEVSDTRVEAEWLFRRAAKAARAKPEVELFYRSGQDIAFHSRQFGGIISELVKNAAVRENALLLSVAAQFNQPRAVAILEWFSEYLLVLTGRNTDWERALTFLLLRDAETKKDVLSFMADVDFNIKQLKEGKQKSILEDDKDDKTSATLLDWSAREHAATKVVRQVYDNKRAPSSLVDFSLSRDESTGTQRMLSLAGPILTALNTGASLIIDELDARLHPNLSTKIVQLFNSSTTNPNNAQLLFNTHDTNLLTSGNFRRDQIWFTEKNRYGEATLYSLADFKTDQVRKDEDFEANYIRGKYGAVPYLGDFNALPKAAATPDAEPGHEQPQ